MSIFKFLTKFSIKQFFSFAFSVQPYIPRVFESSSPIHTRAGELDSTWPANIMMEVLLQSFILWFCSGFWSELKLNWACRCRAAWLDPYCFSSRQSSWRGGGISSKRAMEEERGRVAVIWNNHHYILIHSTGGFKRIIIIREPGVLTWRCRTLRNW